MTPAEVEAMKITDCHKRGLVMTVNSEVLGARVLIAPKADVPNPDGLVVYTWREAYIIAQSKPKAESLRFTHEVKRQLGGTIESIVQTKPRTPFYDITDAELGLSDSLAAGRTDAAQQAKAPGHHPKGVGYSDKVGYKGELAYARLQGLPIDTVPWAADKVWQNRGAVADFGRVEIKTTSKRTGDLLLKRCDIESAEKEYYVLMLAEEGGTRVFCRGWVHKSELAALGVKNTNPRIKCDVVVPVARLKPLHELPAGVHVVSSEPAAERPHGRPERPQGAAYWEAEDSRKKEQRERIDLAAARKKQQQPKQGDKAPSKQPVAEKTHYEPPPDVYKVDDPTIDVNAFLPV